MQLCKLPSILVINLKDMDPAKNTDRGNDSEYAPISPILTVAHVERKCG